MTCRNKRISKQCAKCPWKKSTDPHDIPGGYSTEKHRELVSTIASGLASLREMPRMMACHESPNGAERPCVGWLNNQLRIGNNIALRMAVHQGALDHLVDFKEFEVFGKQHDRLEDTFPND